MKYKHPRLQQQYKHLHPQLVEALTKFDNESRNRGWPEPILTHALRSLDTQEALYYKGFMRKGMLEPDARKAARAKFSWHLVGCAADLRNRHYSEKERKDIEAWLKETFPRPEWEVVQHDVGAGDHFHIGRRDFTWR